MLCAMSKDMPQFLSQLSETVDGIYSLDRVDNQVLTVISVLLILAVQ